MRARAREVLFEESVDYLKSPMFENAYDLARRLVEYGIRGIEGKEKAVGAYLAQVITHRQRKCSDDLREDILEAVKERLTQGSVEDPERRMWHRRARYAIEADQFSWVAPQLISADELFADLLGASWHVAEQFIITPLPAEVARAESERAETLHEILLYRLGLWELANDGTAGSATTHYTFNFPDRETADNWWQELVGSVLGMARQPGNSGVTEIEIRELLHQLYDGGQVVAQVIPPHMCACPTVVFDPLLSSARGYNLYYHRGKILEDPETKDRISVALMDGEALGKWKKLLFWPIQYEKIKPEPVPCP